MLTQSHASRTYSPTCVLASLWQSPKTRNEIFSHVAYSVAFSGFGELGEADGDGEQSRMCDPGDGSRSVRDGEEFLNALRDAQHPS